MKNTLIAIAGLITLSAPVMANQNPLGPYGEMFRVLEGVSPELLQYNMMMNQRRDAARGCHQGMAYFNGQYIGSCQ